MKRFLLVLLFATSLRAADVEVGAQHVVFIPRDSGTLDIEVSRGFGAHAEVFWRDAVSTRFAATFLNPASILFPENPPPGDVDLGTLGLDIYSATARFHVPLRGGFSAFAGAGPAYVSIGNLDDRFGEAVEIDFDPQTTFVAEAGIRYRVHPRVVLEAGASYLPLELNGAPPPLQPTVGIDPLTISAGAAWRF